MLLNSYIWSFENTVIFKAENGKSYIQNRLIEYHGECDTHTILIQREMLLTLISIFSH